MSEVTDWIKLNLPEITPGQAKMLARYIKQLRVKEVDDYADYLSDMETQAAFEMGYQQYSYTKIREIDNE